jgi:ribosomal protein S27AE
VSRWPLLVALAGGLALGSCRVDGPSTVACARMCELALRCGFLPSSLGGRAGEPPEALSADCERRCENSGDSAVVGEIEACFTGVSFAGACEFDDCQAAADCVRRSESLPDAVLGEATISIRLLDGVLWSVAFREQVCDDATPMVKSDYGLDNYCGLFRDDEAPTTSNYACAGRAVQPPLCRQENCETHENCDPTLCYTPAITAEADCDYYGITSVQLGYRDTSGVLVLSPDLLTCAQASEVGTEFTDVPYGALLPVALFEGTISARVANDLGLKDVKDVVGASFCWASYPQERRLVHSGRTEFVVPTPSTAQLYDRVYERNREFPIGCGCVFDTIDCEETAEDCVNGIDDDDDGLKDAVDFGCAPPIEQECKNGSDDDNDGKTDQESPYCERCGNGDPDDDHDGRVEGQEPECVRCGDGIIGPGEWCDSAPIDGVACTLMCTLDE